MSFGPLRTLTDLTGADANADRTTVIASFEVSYPALWAGVWGLIPGAALALVFGGIFGTVFGLIGFLIGEAATMVLILGRSSQGLKRKHYETLKDRNTFTPNVFTLCGKRIDPHMSMTVRVISSSVPLVPFEDDKGVDSVFGLEERTQITSREVDVAAFNPLIAPHRQRRNAHRSGVIFASDVPEPDETVTTILSGSKIPGVSGQ